MMKHEEMITLIGDLFMDAYMAGQQTDMSSIQRARADRDRLLHEVKEVFLELEHESYEREQNQVDLQKANKEIINLGEKLRSLQEEIERRKAEKAAIFNGTPCLGMKNRLSEIYGRMLTEPTEDELDHWASYPENECVPNDGDKFSEQDLPFPDVDDLAPASELLGGDE